MSSSTSNSSAVKRFLIRFVSFCLPLVVAIAPLEYYLWSTGESLPAAMVLDRQASADGEVLYGRGLLNQQFNVYKLAGWQRLEPRFVAIGSSRVWRLRSFAFHPFEDAFYNAGGILQCADDLRALADRIVAGETPKPDALLIGIDPWWFKADHRDVTWLTDASLRDDAFRLAARRNVLRRIISDPSLLQRAPNSESYIGIFASQGFRLDGTMKMPTDTIASFQQNPIYVDREEPPIIERIHRLSGRFRPSPPSPDRLRKSVSAIRRLRSIGIRVIAYFPPFADESWDAIANSPPIMRWMGYYLDEVIPVLTAEADEAIALTHSRSFGLDDTYFKDGMHPGELFAALQWIALVEREKGKPFYQQFAPQHVRGFIDRHSSTPLAVDEAARPSTAP